MVIKKSITLSFKSMFLLYHNIGTRIISLTFYKVSLTNDKMCVFRWKNRFSRIMKTLSRIRNFLSNSQSDKSLNKVAVVHKNAFTLRWPTFVFYKECVTHFFYVHFLFITDINIVNVNSKGWQKVLSRIIGRVTFDS